MKRRTLERLMLFAVLAIAVFGVLSIFTCFRRRMNRDLDNIMIDFLSQSVDTQAAAFQTKLSDQLIMLESQTRYFTDVDLTDYNAMKSTIMSTRGIASFTSIGVASATGSTMNYQGKSSGNILLHDYFQRAMEGESTISAEPTLDEFGNEVLTLAVPIWQEGGVAGAVYGTFTQKALSELLESVQFSGRSASVLITGSGMVLARTNETNLMSDKQLSNIEDLIPGLDVAEIKDARYYAYEYEGSENILVFRPVGFQNWRFGTVIPRSAVDAQRARILRHVALVMLEVVGVIGFLLFYIFRAGKRNEKEKQRLSEKACFDPLTKILNKVAFQEAVEHALAGARDRESCALYIIDMDNFKSVNDNLGHAMGDKVLVDAAKKLQQIFRNSDLVGRIGGDEFAAFLHCPKDRVLEISELAAKKAETVLANLNAVYQKGGKQVQVSVSIGVAIYPSHGKNYASLYENADKALYIAKE